MPIDVEAVSPTPSCFLLDLLIEPPRVSQRSQQYGMTGSRTEAVCTRSDERCIERTLRPQRSPARPGSIIATFGAPEGAIPGGHRAFHTIPCVARPTASSAVSPYRTRVDINRQNFCVEPLAKAVVAKTILAARRKDSDVGRPCFGSAMPCQQRGGSRIPAEAWRLETHRGHPQIRPP